MHMDMPPQVLRPLVPDQGEGGHHAAVAAGMAAINSGWNSRRVVGEFDGGVKKKRGALRSSSRSKLKGSVPYTQ